MASLATLRVPDSATLASDLADAPRAFTRSEILTRWSRRHLDRAVSRGEVVRILPGVYVAAVHQHDPVARARAATLWAPRALVTGMLALHLHAPGLPTSTIVELVTDHGDRLHPPPWIRVHQSGLPAERTVARGIPTVTPARALVDAWALAPPAYRNERLWQALWSGVCTWSDLAREVERTPRLPDRRRLERVLGWFAEGATSPLEVRAKHETFVGAAFADFEWQVPIDLGARTVRADMLHRRAKLVVELDGDRYHATKAERDADRERQNALVAAGFTVLRFGWNDIVHRPAACRALVTAAVGRATGPMSR
ncbi:type IV toxin-antitoxin system AbiEi family antitoxin domain-containing protein [Demequina sp. NBRC 110051]|uniref:type IV toxin-antitoxin system AbiEi family antitoxin domain-containing protein n=1 Tax=Demequina sp. NBRC 110051 TaxID=1570340 RepID=UPI000A054D5E|nr:type IV toxin-antitoxin system AbiEi family antitoxin domain-containing protein [Demequina sp. NBRC 110051]